MAECKEIQVKQAGSETGRRRVKRWSGGTITVTYGNKMAEGVFERVLAGIYVEKVRSGKLDV